MRRLALAALCLVACKQDPKPAAGSGSAAPPTPVARDAAPPVDAAGPLVELLHHTKSVVAVSSTVLNPKYQPEALVDGVLTTAWNSRTGDLAGSWMAFRVPPDAFVTAVKLDVGFDSKGPEGDYFTQNHRLKRVRISRGNKVLADAPLDPDKRGLQTIEINAPGGDFRIQVVAVVPGTRKLWRETVVSELEVWGHTPAPLAKPASPTVKVGSLDGVEHDPMGGPFPSVDSYCEEWAKPIREAVAAEDVRCKDAPASDMDCQMRGGNPRCEHGDTLQAPSGAFKGAQIVTLNNGDGFLGNFPCLLLVQTRAGWFPTEQVRCTSGEGTNILFNTVELAMHGKILVWHYTVDEDITGDKSSEDILVTCDAADDGSPLCTSEPNKPE